MANVSHGRGGAGNIGPDDTLYSDAGIVREGPTGDQGDGAYSAGRGGAGNIGSPGQKPKKGTQHDREMIPEMDLRPGYDDYHVGRGGAGNEHHEKPHKQKQPEGQHEGKHEAQPEGLADKLKQKIIGNKGKGSV